MTALTALELETWRDLIGMARGLGQAPTAAERATLTRLARRAWRTPFPARDRTTWWKFARLQGLAESYRPETQAEIRQLADACAVALERALPSASRIIPD